MRLGKREKTCKSSEFWLLLSILWNRRAQAGRNARGRWVEGGTIIELDLRSDETEYTRGFRLGSKYYVGRGSRCVRLRCLSRRMCALGRKNIILKSPAYYIALFCTNMYMNHIIAAVPSCHVISSHPNHGSHPLTHTQQGDLDRHGALASTCTHINYRISC